VSWWNIYLQFIRFTYQLFSQNFIYFLRHINILAVINQFTKVINGTLQNIGDI